MAYEKEIKEILEAQKAGDDALYYLEGAKEFLQSAGNWGIADLLGGGIFISMIKRNKMREAKTQIEMARNAMAAFSRELADVDRNLSLELDMDDFLGFADFFFDNFFVDMMVQSKISRARAQVDEAIDRVNDTMDLLDGILRRYESAGR